MPDPKFERCLRAVLSALSLAPDSDQLAKLQAHFDLLGRWNRRISLTSIGDSGEIAKRHFGESLFLAQVISQGSATLIDVGSGAGFPGIPIAVMRRDVQVTLIESVGKKATFLREVTRDYPNVRVLQVRLESIDGHFDWATVRAVAPGPLLDLLSERATNLALLIGQKDASELVRSDLFDFDSPRCLPWGDQRVLLVGRSRRLE